MEHLVQKQLESTWHITGNAREAERILDATGYLTLRRAERLVAKQVAASTFDMLDMKEAQLNTLLDEISREAELYLAEVSREAELYLAEVSREAELYLTEISREAEL